MWQIAFISNKLRDYLVPSYPIDRPNINTSPFDLERLPMVFRNVPTGRRRFRKIHMGDRTHIIKWRLEVIDPELLFQHGPATWNLATCKKLRKYIVKPMSLLCLCIELTHKQAPVWFPWCAGCASSKSSNDRRPSEDGPYSAVPTGMTFVMHIQRLGAKSDRWFNPGFNRIWKICSCSSSSWRGLPGLWQAAHHPTLH